jgi:hypothetical protein
MAENPIQEDPDTPGPRSGTQRRKVLFGSQQRIDFLIIGRVISVVGSGFEHRIQIEDLRP